jgi:pilus assembly protein FimV
MGRITESSLSDDSDNRHDNIMKQVDDREGSLDAMEDSPVNELRDLKAVILSLDWEITDETISGLFDQLDFLKKKYPNEKILLGFYKLLSAVGKYISQNKGNSHPNAIRLLNSSYKSLEKILDGKKMPEAESKKLLAIEINRFEELKRQIAQRRGFVEAQRRKAPAKKPEMVTYETVSEPGAGIAGKPAEIQGDLAIVLEEIKKLLRAEFQVLRKMLEKR